MTPEIEIINQAIRQYTPLRVFALFSGGDDSVCAAHLASQAQQFDGVVYIDTGIKIEQTFEHAREVARRFGWPFRVVETPENYDEIVLKHGFPGPAAHRYMYIMLKERAIERLMRDVKQKRSDRIMFVTGVRRYESRRRMASVTSAVKKVKARIWVAPMWEWTEERKRAYMCKHDLPENPVKRIMHISGDCLCGAYNDKGDLEILRMFYPKEAARIMQLQERVMQQFPWAWDEKPPTWWKDVQNGQMFLADEFMPLCWQCEHAAT